jgi:hypothetical protein
LGSPRKLGGVGIELKTSALLMMLVYWVKIITWRPFDANTKEAALEINTKKRIIERIVLLDFFNSSIFETPDDG